MGFSFDRTKNCRWTYREKEPLENQEDALRFSWRRRSLCCCVSVSPPPCHRACAKCFPQLSCFTLSSGADMLLPTNNIRRPASEHQPPGSPSHRFVRPVSDKDVRSRGPEGVGASESTAHIRSALFTFSRILEGRNIYSFWINLRLYGSINSTNSIFCLKLCLRAHLQIRKNMIFLSLISNRKKRDLKSTENFTCFFG